MALNPSIRYDWIAQNAPSKEEAEKEVENAQAVVKAYVSYYVYSFSLKGNILQSIDATLS